MVAEGLRGNARVSILGIGCWESVPGFEMSSLGIILLEGDRTLPRSYRRNHMSIKRSGEKNCRSEEAIAHSPVREKTHVFMP